MAFRRMEAHGNGRKINNMIRRQDSIIYRTESRDGICICPEDERCGNGTGYRYTEGKNRCHSSAGGDSDLKQEGANIESPKAEEPQRQINHRMKA